MRPDLLIGMITLIDGELDVHDPGFKLSFIRTPTTITPLLRWQPRTMRLTSLTKNAFLQANQRTQART
jgi:hypothetical protein